MIATQRLALVVLLAVVALASAGNAAAQQSTMTFFVTSSGLGKGAARRRRRRRPLPSAGPGGRRRQPRLARLSEPHGRQPDQCPRSDRRRGPWQNAKGEVIADDVEDLHSANNKLTKQTTLSEKGDVINGRGDTPIVTIY